MGKVIKITDGKSSVEADVLLLDKPSSFSDQNI